VTFHSLRHTALSRLANHPSIPLVYVGDFAGHATLATTETYVHKLESAETTAAPVLAMAGTSGTFAARTAGNGGGLTGNGREPGPAQQSRSHSERIRKATAANDLKQPLIAEIRPIG
jgi:hypothetical protein